MSACRPFEGFSNNRILIINALAQGPKNIKEIADATGIMTSCISRNLRVLQSEGITARTLYIGVRVEHCLTEKGIALHEILANIMCIDKE